MVKSSPPASQPDSIFLGEEIGRGEFRFDERVAQVFPDMLRRSIPGYRELLQLLGILAVNYVKANSAVYDLGASLGAVSLAIRHAVGDRMAEIIAVDNSSAMVERMQQIFEDDNGLCPVEVQQRDLQSLKLKPASMIVVNFTLQFIPFDERAALIKRLADALLPDGVLVISEKVSEEDNFYRNLHDSFRAHHGYSQLEMSRKRKALEDVLIPASSSEMETWLSDAGLRTYPLFRALQFVSWAAVKPKLEGRLSP